MAARRHMPFQLLRITTSPMSILGFEDFANLRSGWDKYSSMRLPELRREVDALAMARIEGRFPDDEMSQARAYRWVLRGLSVDKAIRKVAVDLKVSEQKEKAKDQKGASGSA